MDVAHFRRSMILSVPFGNIKGHVYQLNASMKFYQVGLRGFPHFVGVHEGYDSGCDFLYITFDVFVEMFSTNRRLGGTLLWAGGSVSFPLSLMAHRLPCFAQLHAMRLIWILAWSPLLNACPLAICFSMVLSSITTISPFYITLFGFLTTGLVKNDLCSHVVDRAKDALLGLGKGTPFSLFLTEKHFARVASALGKAKNDLCHVSSSFLIHAKLSSVMKMEYRKAIRSSLRDDFLEGVRAVLVDKDKRDNNDYKPESNPREES
ncbi:hypothetical protein Syun_025916 [Stephania yunnanensis]|uniref:Enoyl-CoA hydratase/isomerase domain-containing protein n=1 Tax=Stephania yunnanensis TaxID=152371 RepID=A0AAP0ESL0_9MAGN